MQVKPLSSAGLGVGLELSRVGEVCSPLSLQGQPLPWGGDRLSSSGGAELTLSLVFCQGDTPCSC